MNYFCFLFLLYISYTGGWKLHVDYDEIIRKRGFKQGRDTIRIPWKTAGILKEK